MERVKVNGEPVRYDKLPEFCRDIVERYIEKGIHPGSGWAAILRGDLKAVILCDDETVAALPQIVRWLYSDAPGRCHGTSMNIEDWMEKRALAQRAA